jgi:hypothetical protein
LQEEPAVRVAALEQDLAGVGPPGTSISSRETSRHDADRPLAALVVGMTPGNTSSHSSTTPNA